MANKFSEPLEKMVVAIIMSLFILSFLSGIYWLSITFLKFDISTILTIFIGFVAIIAVSITFMNGINKNPSLLIISLIGFPESGKTVYISVLFREFLTKEISNIAFSPYGLETNEKVSHNWNLLTSGQWLPHTENEERFPYSAVASVGKGWSENKYTIQLRDFAGSNIKMFNQEEKIVEDRWLHNSNYFKNFAESDVIFFAIDGKEIVKAIDSNDYNQISRMENSIITALNLVKEYKNVQIGNKMIVPVGLIFTKWDLIIDRDRIKKSQNSEVKSEDMINGKELELFKNLIAIGRKNCYNFEVFNVSSVGHLAEDGSPPRVLEPINVTLPIEWALRIKSI
jgi:hypothetical protein